MGATYRRQFLRGPRKLFEFPENLKLVRGVKNYVSEGSKNQAMSSTGGCIH